MGGSVGLGIGREGLNSMRKVGSEKELATPEAWEGVSLAGAQGTR